MYNRNEEAIQEVYPYDIQSIVRAAENCLYRLQINEAMQYLAELRTRMEKVEEEEEYRADLHQFGVRMDAGLAF